MGITEQPIELTRSVRDVSVTERGSFRSCRRRWVVEVLDNWSPKAPQWALEFGTGIHSALEMYYKISAGWVNTSRCGEPLDLVLEELISWYEDMTVKQGRLLGPLFTEEAKDELWEMKNLGVTMLTNYAEFSGDIAEKDPWEIVAVEGRGAQGELLFDPIYKNAAPFMHEGRILVPIVHPLTKRCLPGRPYLSARIDLLVKRGRSGKIWVVDHKTSATAPNDRGIDFEDQITGYSYVVWRLTSMLVAGTIFNYLVKQAPKEPRTIQPTKQNPTGLSTAKDQLCLAKDYRKALVDSGMMVKGSIASTKHAECYAALLATGWDPYFRRFEVQRNMHEVLSFEERLYQEYRDMRDVFRHPEKAYPNLSTWHCPSCSVAPICQAMEDGSDVAGIIESRYMQAPDRKAER